MKRLSPLKSIRKYCLECSGDSWMEVKLCVIEECHLYPYRLGHRPKRASTTDRPSDKTKNKATLSGKGLQEIASGGHRAIQKS